uniref:Uncharacterized protein n=1 Tax=Octactis speculum TaxID=3111310 RepID=A0A7S2AQP2_9STRA
MFHAADPNPTHRRHSVRTKEAYSHQRIHVNDLMNWLHETLSDARLSMVQRAWNELIAKADGVSALLSREVFVAHLKVAWLPGVRKASVTDVLVREAFEYLFFGQKHDRDSGDQDPQFVPCVDKTAFIDGHSVLSSSIDGDRCFEAFLERTWGEERERGQAGKKHSTDLGPGRVPTKISRQRNRPMFH